MAIGDPYISVQELKDVVGISDDSEDVLVERAVKAATQAINNRSGFATFWNTGLAEIRTVDTEGKIVPKRGVSPYYKLLLPDGIASTGGFSVSGFPTATLMPSDAIAKGEPATALKLSYGSLPASVQITAVWGWPSLPDDIVMAAQMQAHRYYRRRGSPEGIAGSAEWGLSRVPRLDPDVAAILENGGYMNPGIG